MNRKEIIEKALKNGTFNELEFNNEDKILFEIFKENLGSENFKNCAIIASELYTYEPPKLNIIGTRNDTIESKNRQKRAEKNKVKIQDLLNKKIEAIINKDNFSTFLRLVNEFQNFTFSIEDSIIYATKLLLKQRNLQQIINLFKYLNSIEYLYFPETYIPSMKYAIEKKEEHFLNSIFDSFLIWQKNYLEIATDIEQDIIALLVKHKQDDLLIKLFIMVLEINEDWYFADSYDFIFNIDQTFAILILDELIQKHSEHIILYATLFRNLAINKQRRDADEIITIMNANNKIEVFLNELVKNYIHYNDSVSERNEIINTLIRNKTIDRKMKNRIQVIAYPILKKISQRHKALLEQARIEERNRIMANLSHTVKNMISTIIDPLENMKTAGEMKPVAIDNAIRGANLVRSLVNAMNLSFKGSIEDFKYDITNVDYKDATSIKQLFIDSLKYSISSMFDGKYFNKFMRNYFPDKPIFIEAKNKWNEISQSTDLKKIISFLDEFMLKSEIDIETAKDFVIGNDKGSSLKFLILIQEIILNAIKYSSFVSQKSRNLKIEFDANKEYVTIKVTNIFKHDVSVKSTGLGQEIINNFSKLLQTKPVIKTDDETYSVEIKFENMWED